MKERKIAIFVVLLVLITGIAAVSAEIPGAPDNIDVVRSDGALNFTWDVNATEANITNGYNATIYGSGVWSNGTNTYYYLSGLNKGDSHTATVWAYNKTGEGNLSIYYASKSGTVLGGTSRGAPALSPIGIVAAIGLWSILILVYNRRKR